MDQANLIENKMKHKAVRIESISNENIETQKESINPEQDKVIEQLEDVLKFLKSVTINNEDSLANLKKPLDDLRASLKFIPVDSSFSILPIEIKTKILNYCDMCDNRALVVASVCLEWKDILHTRLNSFKNICIGKHCSYREECQRIKCLFCEEDNCSYNAECERSKCFKPEEMLKASIILELDVPLSICHPVTDVDSELVKEALTSASNISLNDDCVCKLTDDEYGYDDKPLLTPAQVENLFIGLEKKNKILESMELIGLDLTDFDQDRVMNCLLNKTKKFTFKQDPDFLHQSILDIKTLTIKLRDTESKLEHLNIGAICDYPDELSVDFADALCQVSTVKLSDGFPLKAATAKVLVENIRFSSFIRMKTLDIEVVVDWRALVNPLDLKDMIDNMDVISLRGTFTLEQLEAARSANRVQISSIDTADNEDNFFRIFKGSL